MPLSLSEVAGWMLKGSDHPEPPPGKGAPVDTFVSLERISGSVHPPPSVSESIGCEGMVGNAHAESRGHSANISSWARTRPLSDIREITEPSLAETIPRRLLSEKQLPRSISRTELTRKPSAASRRPSLDSRLAENREPDRKTSIDSNALRSARRGRPPQKTGDHSYVNSSFILIPVHSSMTSVEHPPLSTSVFPASTAFHQVAFHPVHRPGLEHAVPHKAVFLYQSRL